MDPLVVMQRKHQDHTKVFVSRSPQSDVQHQHIATQKRIEHHTVARDCMASHAHQSQTQFIQAYCFNRKFR